MNIPNDPVMLLSVINTLLRDRYSSFTGLCDDLSLDGKSIQQKLQAIGYAYSPDENRFQ